MFSALSTRSLNWKSGKSSSVPSVTTVLLCETGQLILLIHVFSPQWKKGCCSAHGTSRGLGRSEFNSQLNQSSFWTLSKSFNFPVSSLSQLWNKDNTTLPHIHTVRSNPFLIWGAQLYREVVYINRLDYHHFTDCHTKDVSTLQSVVWLKYT